MLPVSRDTIVHLVQNRRVHELSATYKYVTRLSCAIILYGNVMDSENPIYVL